MMQSKKYDGQVTTTLPNAYFQTYIFDAIKKKLKKSCDKCISATQTVMIWYTFKTLGNVGKEYKKYMVGWKRKR